MPGRSSNAGGRPRGFGALIQKQTQEGAELVTFYLTVFRDPRAKLAYRMEAVQWLADRGFGKPAQAVQVTGEDGGPIEVTVVWPDA